MAHMDYGDMRQDAQPVHDIIFTQPGRLISYKAEHKRLYSANSYTQQENLLKN